MEMSEKVVAMISQPVRFWRKGSAAFLSQMCQTRMIDPGGCKQVKTSP